jgi:hypothetical protein
MLTVIARLQRNAIGVAHVMEEGAAGATFVISRSLECKTCSEVDLEGLALEG